MKNNLQMAMLLPMLTAPKALDVPDGSVLSDSEGKVTHTFSTGTKLATVKDDSLSMMLPLMLLGDGLGGGDSSSMLLMVLAMSGGL